MPIRTLLVGVLLIAAVACTGGSSSTQTSAADSASPLPTVNIDAKIVPGEWTYDLRGLKATFTWKEGPATLTVKNGSGADVGAPAVYIVTQDQKPAGVGDSPAVVRDCVNRFTVETVVMVLSLVVPHLTVPPGDTDGEQRRRVTYRGFPIRPSFIKSLYSACVTSPNASCQRPHPCPAQ
ncbi:MAG: hypothetical protein ACJ740_14360 [Gaiellales bacterium]